MRFQKLHLQNFRPFKNETIDFSQDLEKNVTVIHGQNGSGKTTLLNAFTWILYGEVGFEMHPGRLVNQGVMAEASPSESVQVEGELQFEHDGTDYRLTRRVVFEKQRGGDFDGRKSDEQLSLEYRESKGRWSERQNPAATIEQIVPERLSDLFFFDGEYINKLTGVDHQGEIQGAIRNIMGLTILERSIRHLDEVETRFEDKVKEHGSEQLQELIDNKRELEGDLSDIETKIKEKQEKRSRLGGEISDIEQKLERMGDTKQLQEEREQKESKREELEENVEEINKEIQTEISKKGYLPFAMPAIESTAREIDKLREDGVIPSELSNKFVDDLLDRGVCICGRPLEQNSEHYQQVVGYKSDATSEGVDQAALRLIAHLDNIRDRRKGFFESVKDQMKRRKDILDEIDKLTEEIDEIGQQIASIDGYDPETDESPAELEKARESKKATREELKEEIVRLDEQKSMKNEELDEVQEKYEAEQEEKAQADLARKRMKAAGLARRQLEASFEQLQQQVRDWSNERVKQTFDTVATKDYVAEITDDFELTIKDSIDGESIEVDKSRGERQIASLAFIGSLIAIAKERYEADTDTQYFTGGIYPVVMDSPFGALDNEHRREISRIIPALADQVVVMVTDSQWDGPVAEEMEEIAGRQYRLRYHPGDGNKNHPKTEIELEREITAGGQ
jgi:DNA sulfur modification protein DndD